MKNYILLFLISMIPINLLGSNGELFEGLKITQEFELWSSSETGSYMAEGRDLHRYNVQHIKYNLGISQQLSEDTFFDLGTMFGFAKGRTDSEVLDENDDISIYFNKISMIYKLSQYSTLTAGKMLTPVWEPYVTMLTK